MTRADVIARLKILEPQIRAHGVAALYLYGSYARDEAGPDSDIDILADLDATAEPGLMGLTAPYLCLEDAFPGIEIGFSTREGLVSHYRPSIEQSVIRIF